MQKNKSEFIILMALLMAMVALSIDAMLPALSFIASDLSLVNDNDRQFVVTTIFVGLGIGQLIYGPVSDSVGRKPVVIFGVFVFLFSSILCAYANSFYILLLGRFLQGLGAAAASNIATAIVRDGFKGDEMAKMMSIILAVFIGVPMIAPSLGQLILAFSDWRTIFLALFALAAMLLCWFVLRQPETLLPSNRRRFSIAAILDAYKEVLMTKVSVAYASISGLVFGAFITFLSSSQQLLQEDYETGKFYVLYFATLAAAFCIAAMVNSRFVMRLGAAKMVRIALIGLLLVSLLFIIPAWLTSGKPMLILLMLYLLLNCFGTGLLMGNLSALAMAPLGHIAGSAAAVVGGISTLMAVCIASTIGQYYAGNVYPFIFAFLIASALSLSLSQFIGESTK